jgi:hypothetical protein
MEEEKIVIEATVAGKTLPLRIEKQQEAVHKQANELLNKRYAMYEAQHQAMRKEDILAMTAYSLSVQVIDLQNMLLETAKKGVMSNL